MPERPRANEQVSEVRSDAFVGGVHMPAAHTAFTVAPVFIQWRFSVSYKKSAQLHAFLVENEQFIAESCERILSGVHYRGTYMGLSGQRALYTTLWGYDHLEAQSEWNKVLNDRDSRFYKAVRKLRSYWTDDPNSTQENFGAAAGVDLLKEGFLALTVDSENEAS